MTLDAAALPPEINVARLISGASAVPMQAKAAAYASLAATWEQGAVRLAGLLAELSTTYEGPTAALVQARYAPYVAWLHSTSAQLGVSGARAQTQAASYIAAVAAMPTLAELAEIQTQHAILVATNPLVAGANTPAIAANEAAYAAEWARASAVQASYFAETAANSVLDVYLPAPPLANPPAGTAEATQAATMMDAALSPIRDSQIAVVDAIASQSLAAHPFAEASSDTQIAQVRADEQRSQDQSTARHATTSGTNLVGQPQIPWDTAGQVAGGVAQQAMSMPTQAASTAYSTLSPVVQEKLMESGITGVGFPGTSSVSPTLSRLQGGGGGPVTPVGLGTMPSSLAIPATSVVHLPGTWAPPAATPMATAASPAPAAAASEPAVAATPMSPMASSLAATREEERSSSAPTASTPVGPVYVDPDSIDIDGDGEALTAAHVFVPSVLPGDGRGDG